jgi:hypothetical protein
VSNLNKIVLIGGNIIYCSIWSLLGIHILYYNMFVYQNIENIEEGEDHEKNGGEGVTLTT